MKTTLSLTDQHRSVVVIPAYQPSERLIDLAEAVSGFGCAIVIVDDGSSSRSDYFWHLLSHYAAIIHHPENRGKGVALKTAFSFIEESMPEADCIITMDADGQHLPRDMERVALCARSHPGALVLGSRSFEGEVPLRSRLGNGLTRLVFSAVSGQRVNDTQTGLRAFDRSLLEELLSVSGERYEYEMNVLLHCADWGIPMLEVPIQTVYLDRENSSSHFDGVRDSFRIYKNILKFASASFVSFLADYLLFLLLTALLPAGAAFLVAGNVLARLGSAALNYTLNTRAVFRDDRPMRQTLPQYALLAAGILAANSLLLTLLTSALLLPATLAKLLTEGTLFLVSFAVQSLVIYHQPEPREKKGGVCHARRKSA